MNPDIRLSIERLVLDGLDLSPGDAGLVQAAFEAELTRLLCEGGLPAAWQGGAAVPALPAAAVTVSPNPGPAGIGQQAAQSVYGSFGGGHG
ncbi:MAG TPA: hypothetical protein VF806_05295 [Anaerolineaceae bacterium]